MITIPPLLHQLVVDDKVDPMVLKVYRFFKMYSDFGTETSKGRILSDLEMDSETFERLLKQLEEYGFMERIKHPGKSSEYRTKLGMVYR